MHLARRLLAGLLACALAGQPLRANELPELGDIASEELSLATEKKIGQQIMNQIRWREPSYLDDPDVETYLNQLGGRLVAVSSDPVLGFQFFAIDDPSINAFAMPGGFIGVHTGLILSAQTESELAGVLAHEVSHVTQRHIARQVFQSKKLSMASMVAMGLALLAARSSPQGAGAAITASQAGMLSAQLAYSRDFEREADRLGFDTLRTAGFDPGGMPGFFERLQQSSRLYENNATAYLRTHPLTVERLSDMQNRQQTLAYRQVADGQDFILVRARIRALQGRPVDAVRDFETLLREKKYVSEGGARYGLAVALARNGSWAAAEQELLKVRKLNFSSVLVDRLLAEALIGRGEKEAGLVLYREAMARYPLNLSLRYGYGNALLAERRYTEALAFSDTQLQSYSQDARFYKMRAEANAGLGRRAQQHLALAEMSMLKGQPAGAIEQLQLAQQAGDANFYEMSVIDGDTTSAHVIADMPSEVLKISQDALWELVQASHAIARNLLYVLSTRMRYGNELIVRNMRTQRVLEIAATFDALTGVHNRGWMDRSFPRVMLRCAERSQSFSILMIDIDNFKKLNDTWRHVCGDQALVAVAASLLNNLRPEDMLARFGGEEFIVGLPNTGLDDAFIVAERLRRGIEFLALPFRRGEPLPHLTISIGIARMMPGQTVTSLIAAADEALYRAKEGGRNRVML